MTIRSRRGASRSSRSVDTSRSRARTGARLRATGRSRPGTRGRLSVSRCASTWEGTVSGGRRERRSDPFAACPRACLRGVWRPRYGRTAYWRESGSSAKKGRNPIGPGGPGRRGNQSHMPRTAPASTGAEPPLAGRAFEGLPHGLLVLDSAGKVQVANRAASELLDLSPRTAPKCCELFGCRSDEGSLAGVCLMEIVPPAGGGHLELRLDLAAGSTWVTAAALDDEQLLVPGRPKTSSRLVPFELGGG